MAKGVSYLREKRGRKGKVDSPAPNSLVSFMPRPTSILTGSIVADLVDKWN